MSTDGKATEQLETERVSEPRTRTLTEKGNSLYREQQQKHVDQLTPLWDIVDSFLLELDQLPADLNDVHNLERRLLPAYEKYRRRSDIYVEFLQSQRTDQGTDDLKAHLALADLNRRVHEEAVAKLQDVANELASQRSTRSKQQKKSSSRSSRDSGSNVSIGTSTSKRQRAKAEAAKAKIAFAEKQAQILKQEAELKEQAERKESQAKLQQAELEQQAKLKQAGIEQRQKEEAALATRKQTELKVEFDLLTAKQEAASAEAAARALEDDDGSQDLGSQLPDQTADPMDRVKDFVDQSSLANSEETEDIDIQTGVNPATSMQNQNYEKPSASLNYGKETHINPTITTSLNTSGSPVLGSGSPMIVKSSTFSRSRQGPSPSFTQPGTTLNASRFTPTQPQLTTEPHVSVPKHYKQHDKDDSVARLLLQREAISTGLTKFKDNPESYVGWKSGFLATIEESNVSDRKQLELLVKWLGPESSKHAESIQMCSSDNPSAGIKKLWERLDELYGAPEMLEASIKRKLDNFTRLTNKDTKRFYDLYNILTEIQFLKENPKFRSLLAYFDSSSGLKPIVGKLPYGLQEQWSRKALNYKTRHNVAFPPFTEFCVFIAELCKLKNDPSLVLDYDHTPQKQVAKQRFSGRPNVNSHKTEIDKGNKGKPEHFPYRSQNFLPTSQHPKKEEVSHCILHKSKHSLNDCRGFKAKPLEERKRLLKENNVCYRCCASTSHFGRECSAQIKCKDCGSESHPTALHVAKHNKRADVSPEEPANKHGGEQHSSAQPTTVAVETVSNKCTEICGNSYNGKSCAKILPVNVHHKDKPDKIIKMYAIIDEQSNRSLASSEFFRLFNVQEKPVNYALSTCSGKVLTSGKQGNNFVISSVNGEIQFNLPALVECDNIPDNRDEIPTPDVVQHHSHLIDLASQIQPLDENCKIMLLIGRDLPEAHHICEQRTNPDNYSAPFAHRLKLGWVVVGETCINKLQPPLNLNIKRTFITLEGQHTISKPCANPFEIHEQYLDPIKSVFAHEKKNSIDEIKDDRLTPCPSAGKVTQVVKDNQSTSKDNQSTSNKLGDRGLPEFASNLSEVIATLHASSKATNLKDSNSNADNKLSERNRYLHRDVDTYTSLLRLSSDDEFVTEREIRTTLKNAQMEIETSRNPRTYVNLLRKPVTSELPTPPGVYRKKLLPPGRERTTLVPPGTSEVSTLVPPGTFERTDSASDFLPTTNLESTPDDDLCEVMEGILEKPSRIPGKKTKVWSVLDDTTLSFFQENKRSSCIDSVELSDIQSVKKVAETQFEIVTDISSQVYTAVSEEERKQWVEKLSKFSTGADNCKQSTPKSTPVIDIANEEDEHTVEVKSARKIFESTSTERQNTSPKTSVSKTFTWNDGSERSVGVKTAKKIFEAKNNKTNTTERVLTPSLRVNKNSNVEQTFEQKSSKTNLSENNPTTSSVAKILPESTSHNKPVEQVDENSDNEVFDTSVTNTATGVKTRSEKSNANFESKVNRDDNVKPKRPLSNITQEHDKTRKSDHKKSHSWSTITDVKSHLNHVSISDETLKSGRRLSDSLHQNSKTSDSLNPELEQARNKLKHISNIIVKQDKIETMKDEDKTVQSSSEAGSIINIDMISNPVLKDCETVTKSDYAEARENDELDSSSPNCLETTTVVGKTIEENGISANRPDSGYSTTVCENGRNSQENKVDINTANKTEEEKNEIMNSTHLEPEKKEDSTGRFSEDEDEEKEDTIVLMRKSKRSVSVSKTGDVALVPDEKEMELFTANTAFAFPNVRRSKKSSSTIENEDKDKKTPLILSDNSNLPKDITQSISGSFDKTRGDENNLSFNTEDREFGEISPVSGQDKVDGEINSMHPEHELVENYLDIDSIINKVKFPNIPTLPNTTPNRADLLSFHELKESLSYFDSEDEHSDDEVIEREDPVHRLSRLVDI